MRQILRKYANAGAWPATLVTLLLVWCGAAPAQIYTDLYNFNNTSGTSPSDPQVLAEGRDGNLYGTAPQAGTGGGGVAFSVTPDGTLSVIHNFSGADGFLPICTLTLRTEWNLRHYRAGWAVWNRRPFSY